MSVYSCVLEGHFRSATPSTDRIYKALTDEETDGDTDCNLNHAQAERKAAVVLLHRAVVVSSKTTGLSKTRLGRVRAVPLSGILRTSRRYLRHVPVRGRVRRSPSM